MSNFFKSVLHLGEQSVTQPFRSIKKAAHGDFKGGFNDLFHSASKAGQDVAHSVGIRGWVGSHPMQSVGAAVATIFGGWAAWGAYGASAAGGAAGAAGSATGAAAGTAGATGGSSIAAGTVIGQTVPAIPSAASMMSGTGAAVTATPSYSIVAGASGSGASLSSGGYMATHLGGEATVANTGGSTASMGWQDWVRNGNRANNLLNSNSQQSQQNAPEPMRLTQPELTLRNTNAGQSATNNPLAPNSTSEIINNNAGGINAQSFGKAY
ncbi:hypothetical protein OH773_06715 [Buttiauxella sp. WJP83]|uniref:hypothetical protein n=1 Tax=Buttiauxella sp. WJP83 TaxID=2986951 RepID=UPI0022DE77C3|nr:hypothetical protein [Buttiauxella sp. WJP83]WBM71927.1 hypothetical protein OH773_06715 [Buttiauxella sp. WJP83]